jgi:hypothetical protein
VFSAVLIRGPLEMLPIDSAVVASGIPPRYQSNRMVNVAKTAGAQRADMKPRSQSKKPTSEYRSLIPYHCHSPSATLRKSPASTSQASALAHRTVALPLPRPSMSESASQFVRSQLAPFSALYRPPNIPDAWISKLCMCIAKTE